MALYLIFFVLRFCCAWGYQVNLLACGIYLNLVLYLSTPVHHETKYLIVQRVVLHEGDRYKNTQMGLYSGLRLHLAMLWSNLAIPKRVVAVDWLLALYCIAQLDEFYLQHWCFLFWLQPRLWVLTLQIIRNRLGRVRHCIALATQQLRYFHLFQDECRFYK